MRKFILFTTCLLILLDVALIHSFEPKGYQKKDAPRVFVPKDEGKITIRADRKSFLILANRATVEEILDRIAAEKKVNLKFHCQDPSLKLERPANLRFSENSMVKVLGRLLPGEPKFLLLNREGKTVQDEDVAFVGVYSKDCSETEPPVRVFVPQTGHPLLSKPPEEISLEELGEVLKREGPASRRRAADILGLKAEEKGIAYARKALRDENPGVMLAAANALKRLGRKYGPEKVAGAVVARFREKPLAEFLPIIAELEKERIWPIVEEMAAQAGEGERKFIIMALSLTNDRRAIEYLSRIASVSGKENVKTAVYAIGKIGGPEASTALIRLLTEGDPQRQARAAQAVHFLTEGDGVEARLTVERLVRDERASDELVLGLVEISYWVPLEKLIKDATVKPDLKIRALRALAERGTDDAVRVMSGALNDENIRVRLASVEAMAAVVADSAIPHLTQATQDKDAKVRRQAVKGLAEFPGNDQAVRALGQAIHDQDQDVRRGAVDAFNALGKPNEATVGILKDCGKHEDRYVANQAESILRYWDLQ